MENRKILCIIGTRPEAIKMAPVIRRLKTSGGLDVKVIVTGQHREMLDQTLAALAIAADTDLNLMRPNQRLGALTARLLESLDAVYDAEKPDLVIGQGDTTSVFCAALAAFYRQIPFAHVEAGLRSHKFREPFPEEANRVFVGRLADLHFAPTQWAADNLRREGIADSTIYITGNTVIDSLLWVADAKPQLKVEIPAASRLILLTAHRRESFGRPMEDIFNAVRDVLERNPDTVVLFPCHPNPNVREPAERILRGMDRIILCDPLDYHGLVAAMQRAYLILSDSGGIQEEAPALGKPVLVLRTVTDRPEAVEMRLVRLVGTDRQVISAEVQRLLDDPVAYAGMARGVSPYGDGKAADRIADVITGMFAG